MNTPSEALLTDLYQLTMLQGYFEQRMNETAVFEFFVRRLPPKRNFLIAAGLEQVLEFLEGFHFSEEDIAWLGTQKNFHPEFLEFLKDLRFTGDVDAMPEGTLVFANEPLIRITAPMPVAQFIETRLINLLQFQTMIASKAARSVLVAPGKGLAEFGLRRAHGAEAGLLAARACYIAGFTSTSNVLAGKKFGIPISGTMAHAFIQSHEVEEDAFLHFARSNRDNVVFLIDTYNTERGAEKVVKLAPQLKAEGIQIRGVRLDSGDMATLSKRVREILDRGGLQEVKILASGNIEEEELRRMLSAGAQIDGFGIGTRLATSWDFPYLECAYKLQEYDGRSTRKYSEGKVTWPGRKQVFRSLDSAGKMNGDTLALINEALPGEALIQPVMREGKRVQAKPACSEMREYCLHQLSRLPETLTQLEPTEYPVHISEGMNDLVARLERDRRS
ncbi:MAG: nicotinate phosphoribosyltransferase [Verrucomicrobia bacterium]|nr:nicotinate phosphoribosyltransferase [Verrucomicrobiota bacterium]